MKKQLSNYIDFGKKKIVIAPTPWFDFAEFKGKSPVLPDWALIQK